MIKKFSLLKINNSKLQLFILNTIKKLHNYLILLNKIKSN